MMHELRESMKIEVEAWAEVPDGKHPVEFRRHLTSLGNTVLDFDSTIGSNGAYKIAVFVPQQED